MPQPARCWSGPGYGEAAPNPVPEWGPCPPPPGDPAQAGGPSQDCSCLCAVGSDVLFTHFPSDGGHTLARFRTRQGCVLMSSRSQRTCFLSTLFQDDLCSLPLPMATDRWVQRCRPGRGRGTFWVSTADSLWAVGRRWGEGPPMTPGPSPVAARRPLPVGGAWARWAPPEPPLPAGASPAGPSHSSSSRKHWRSWPRRDSKTRAVRRPSERCTGSSRARPPSSRG